MTMPWNDVWCEMNVACVIDFHFNRPNIAEFYFNATKNDPLNYEKFYNFTYTVNNMAEFQSLLIFQLCVHIPT